MIQVPTVTIFMDANFVCVQNLYLQLNQASLLNWQLESLKSRYGTVKVKFQPSGKAQYVKF